MPRRHRPDPEIAFYLSNPRLDRIIGANRRAPYCGKSAAAPDRSAQPSARATWHGICVRNCASYGGMG
jgi:hypothetical protein